MARAGMDQGPLQDFANLLSGTEGERGAELLIVVAHPDDETLGCGGQLHRLPLARILHVTDGAPRNLQDARALGFPTAKAYAQARRLELEAAMAIAGIAREQLIALNFPDQEAVSHLVNIARSIGELLAKQRVDYVLTHAYEGGHPDHDATAFAVHAACRLLQSEGRSAPILIDMPLYRMGSSGEIFQQFSETPSIPVLEVELEAEDLAKKQAMIACFATQAATTASFISPSEHFRLRPDYDFLQLPNAGAILYEHWGLGLTGMAWISAATRAQSELGLSP